MNERMIYVTYDEMQAELLRLHLERHGVPCWLRSMRVGGFQGITFGPLGEIRLMTSTPYAEKGKRLIRQATHPHLHSPPGTLWVRGRNTGKVGGSEQSRDREGAE